MLRCSPSQVFVKVNFSASSRLSASRTNSDEYQFLPKSRIPTLHFQPSLPRLPIPELSKSCERYLRAQKPLRTNEENSLLEKLMKDFQVSDGLSLQKELKLRDSSNRNTSYISAPWFEMYLKDRKPLPINYNPFLVFVDDPKPEYNDQLLRATNLLISSLRFMKSLKANILEPEVYHLNPKKSDTQMFRTITALLPSSISWYGAYLFKAFPLDMSQYENLFGTNRIPEKSIDKLHHVSFSRHIMVMINGHIYKVYVLDESGSIYAPESIFASLKWILNKNSAPCSHPLGVLTTVDRNHWADIRKRMESFGNENLFKDIDNSIFNLILDTTEPTKDYSELIRRYLHSDGTNRWFDKSFSLIIQKNGIAGVNFEHSWGDGVAILRYFTDIYKDSTTNPQIHPQRSSNIDPSANLVKKLDFNLDTSSKQAIEDAREQYSKLCSGLGVEVYEFLEFGRNLCKKYNISPDSLMQLAFQIAYFKLNKKFVSTYESCSTAAFKHGRTETVRPCTIETKAFTEALLSKENSSKENLLKIMKNCSSVHSNLIKDAAMGQGFDRHLFALQLLAQKKGNIPEIFKSPLHKDFNHFTMSTSTLSSDVVMMGGFGPVVPDGFGISYSIWNDRLGSIVTYYKGNADGSGYMECLKYALHKLHDVLK